MSVSSALTGRSFPATAPYQVCDQKLRDFAEATGSQYDGRTAPSTFPIVVAFAAMEAMMAQPDVGISLRRIVHGEQRFSHARPVVAGDVLTATLHVERVRSMGGADVISTRTDIRDAEGDPVSTAFATLVHRGPDAP